jgi:hypothetical protein
MMTCRYIRKLQNIMNIPDKKNLELLNLEEDKNDIQCRSKIQAGVKASS